MLPAAASALPYAAVSGDGSVAPVLKNAHRRVLRTPQTRWGPWTPPGQRAPQTPKLLTAQSGVCPKPSADTPVSPVSASPRRDRSLGKGRRAIQRTRAWLPRRASPRKGPGAASAVLHRPGGGPTCRLCGPRRSTARTGGYRCGTWRLAVAKIRGLSSGWAAAHCGGVDRQLQLPPGGDHHSSSCASERVRVQRSPDGRAERS